MEQLTVLYDETCALCLRCKAWLAGQAPFVRMEILACQSSAARERYGSVPWLGQELVVVSDEGDVWAGPAAFIVALWALREWREWSYRLSGPELAPLAERFFHAISSNRRALAAMCKPDACEGDTCRVPGPRWARVAYR